MCKFVFSLISSYNVLNVCTSRAPIRVDINVFSSNRIRAVVQINRLLTKNIEIYLVGQFCTNKSLSAVNRTSMHVVTCIHCARTSDYVWCVTGMVQDEYLYPARTSGLVRCGPG